MSKKISDSDVIGQLGVALIERRVLEMGHLWHPRKTDAGIDGEIELRNRSTGEVLNHVLFVQSKASTRPFPGENADRFHFICDERDIDYWLGGNAPVILVCSHPDAQEAWWASVKDWFADPGRRSSRRIDFEKKTQAFDDGASRALSELAIPARGIYLPPAPRHETLVSNLLRVATMPERVFFAPTTCRSPHDVIERLKSEQSRASDWLLKDKNVYSFRSLDEQPLKVLCDGAVGSFDAAEWSQSQDPTACNKFVELLTNTLREISGRDLRWHNGRHYLYFRPTPKLTARSIENRGRRRTVFQPYPNKRDPSRIAYYRHSGVYPQFVCHEGSWCLELVPTYHYTVDGRRESRFTGDLLSTIKRFERNAAVLGQVRMWANYFREKTVQRNLLESTDPLLAFGELVTFDADRGIDDDDWRKPAERLIPEATTRLFEES